MNLQTELTLQHARNRTVSAGHRPAHEVMEFVEMYGIHPTLSFDLVKLARAEQLQLAERARLVHAAGGGERGPGIVAAARLAFGGGMIALGQWIRGGAAPEPAEGAAALRLAR